jgi:hypothetical protein
MKKFLASIMLFLSSVVVIGSAGAANVATVNAMSEPQVRIELGQRRNRRWYRNRGYARGNRIGYGRTFARNVQRGRHIYRETYQVRYLPNGMTQTVLISRVRLY